MTKNCTNDVDVAAINRSLDVHGEQIDARSLVIASKLARHEHFADVEGLSEEMTAEVVAAINRSLAPHGEQIVSLETTGYSPAFNNAFWDPQARTMVFGNDPAVLDAMNRSLALHGEAIDGVEEDDVDVEAVNRSLEIHGEQI